MSICLLSVYLGVQVQSLPACVLTEEILFPSVSDRGCIMKVLQMLDRVAHNLERQQELGLSCEPVILEGDKSQPVCFSVNDFQESLGYPDRP